MSSRTLLIDADYLVYAAGFACESTEYLVLHDGEVYEATTDWHTAKKVMSQYVGSTLYKRHMVEPIENCLHSVNKMIEAIQKAVKKNRKWKDFNTEVVLTGSGNFRDRLATIRPYKGNRNPAHQPEYRREIIAHLQQRWDAFSVYGIEADDYVSIYQTEDPDAVVAGIDKDLLQVPGIHYSAQKKKWHTISKQGGLCRQYYQCLMGDTTDNIGGAYRCGQKRAKHVINSCLEVWKEDDTSGLTLEEILWGATVAEYDLSLRKYTPEECGYEDAVMAATENMRLVYMLRAGEFEYDVASDFYTPKLWVPPTFRGSVL